MKHLLGPLTISWSFLLLLLTAVALLTTYLLPAPSPLPGTRAAASRHAASGSPLDAVLQRYGSRLTAATWAPSSAPPPIFFLTAARAWGGSSSAVQAQREEQYATNIGNILSLGFPVYVSVSPGPPPAPGAAASPASGFPLLEELAAASQPGQLRVHYCSQETAVRRRSGGADELLCMQEATLALFRGCLLPVEPFTLISPPPLGCPTADTHVIRMSGRYLMAKYDVLQAIHKRGAGVDAFFKWNANWTETNPIARTVDPLWQPLNVRQVMTFMITMQVRRGKARARLPRLHAVPLPTSLSPSLNTPTPCCPGCCLQRCATLCSAT